MNPFANLHPIVLIVFRCAAVYLFIIMALRIFGRKELAQLSIADLVFILLISNAVQNAMVGPDTSLAGGLAAAGSLFVLNYGFKWWMYRSRRVSRLVQGVPRLLVYKGVVQQAGLEAAEITTDELEAAIREHGVASASLVDMAMLEVDGSISVVSNDYRQRTQHAVGRHGHRKRGFRGRPGKQ